MTSHRSRGIASSHKRSSTKSRVADIRWAIFRRRSSNFGASRFRRLSNWFSSIFGHSAPNVDRPDRVQLVEEGGCRVTSNNEIKGSRSTAGKRCPCPDEGGGEIARFF